MDTQKSIPGVPTDDEQAKANWKLDREKSHARITLTPILAVSDDGEKRFVSVNQNLEIQPYPNPWKFGGMWGSGWYKPEEVEGQIASFHRMADRFIKFGLQIEVINKPEETRHVPTEAQAEEARRRYSDGLTKKAARVKEVTERDNNQMSLM